MDHKKKNIFGVIPSAPKEIVHEDIDELASSIQGNCDIYMKTVECKPKLKLKKFKNIS
jgi:hypothetical protein